MTGTVIEIIGNSQIGTVSENANVRSKHGMIEHVNSEGNKRYTFWTGPADAKETILAEFRRGHPMDIIPVFVGDSITYTRKSLGVYKLVSLLMGPNDPRNAELETQPQLQTV